jgi:hypothetical protein
MENRTTMKRYLALFIGSLIVCAAPMVMAQGHSDHVEVGVFADYFRFAQTNPPANFIGLGGRVAFNMRPSVQLEAEMAYDFKRSFATEFTDGVINEPVTTRLRTLHGLVGPKFQTGSGPLRIFVTGKVGFDNFSVTNQNATQGFKSTIGLDNGRTDFAVYPGGGIEAFAGPIGLRAEIGDEVYFDHGARNNLRVTFGPQIRF